MLPSFLIETAISLFYLSQCSGLASSLQTIGLHHTLSNYISSSGEISSQMFDFQNECSWRLEQWDKFCVQGSKGNFNGCILGCLESAVRSNTDGVDYWAELGLNFLKDKLQNLNITNTSAVNIMLSQLHQISVAQKTSNILHDSADMEANLKKIFEKDNLSCYDFSLQEPIHRQRLILVSQKQKCYLEPMALQTSKLARNSGMYWVCNHLQHYFDSTSIDCRLEEATVLFSQGQKEHGIMLVKKLLSLTEGDQLDPEKLLVVSKANLNLGVWLNEQKSEASSKILEKYLLKSVEILEEHLNKTEGEELMEAYMAVAAFADKLYIQTKDFMNSAQYKERKEALDRNKQEAAILQKATQKQKDLNLPKVIKERFCKLDITEVQSFQDQLLNYLSMSLTYYLSVLSAGNASGAVYRLITLWFNEGNHDISEISQLMAQKLPQVSSYKFIPLLYQMAARMSPASDTETDFSTVLYKLVLRCSIDHPHHCVPIILALVNAKEDEKYKDKNRNNSKEHDSRANAASKIIDGISTDSHSKLVSKYSYLCQSLIQLAYLTADANKSGKISIPGKSSILKVANWDDIAVLTDTLPIRPDKDYSSISGILNFSKEFSMVGGVNAPKKISCLGSDGVSLLKILYH